jgi:hypothetical protein
VSHEKIKEAIRRERVDELREGNSRSSGIGA